MPANSKYLRLALAGIGLIAVVGILVSGGHGTPSLNSQCGPYRTDKVVTINSQKLNTEVAVTQPEKAAGLGGRPCIQADQAMLFDFGQPAQYPMWMKGMRFAIDIVWISSDHRVVGFYNDVKPSTYPDRFVNKKDSPAEYVLELKANRAEQLHITIGTPVNF
jgi:uncharacterized membrane protein (UPF0127 family)